MRSTKQERIDNVDAFVRRADEVNHQRRRATLRSVWTEAGRWAFWGSRCATERSHRALRLLHVPKDLKPLHSMAPLDAPSGDLSHLFSTSSISVNYHDI